MVRAARNLSSPSAVRGPVLRPPCILHRPFAIAGERQGWSAVRVRAPHRGAAFGLPRGLPFLRGPGARAGFSRFMGSSRRGSRPGRAMSGSPPGSAG